MINNPLCRNILCMAALLAAVLGGCGWGSAPAQPLPTGQGEEQAMFTLQIGDTVFPAEFADTEAAAALRQKLAEGSVTVTASNYGGWEQVAALPWPLPQADAQTTARPGDIMLYQGDCIVLFYGENSWAYTRLGRLCAEEAALAAALGGEEAVLTLSLSE